jgi:hypothetical protein
LETGWREDEITWRNAPGNLDSGRSCEPESTTLIGGVFHTADAKVGETFAFTLPRLGDFVQPDQSVTVMLTIDGNSHEHRLASWRHPGLAGPRLIQD